MSSYWAAAGVVLGLEGAAFKYLVWDFIFGKQSLEHYWQSVEEAHNAIHERKFLPIIVAVCDSVVSRKGILPTAETVEILTEFAISVQLREEVVKVLRERVALNQIYGQVRVLSFCVAVPWSACILLSCLVFFKDFDVRAGIKSLWAPHMAVAAFLAGCIGFLGLCLYILVRCKLVRSVRKANSL